MHPDLEEKLWNAAIDENYYTEEEWLEIVYALLEDFKQVMKEDFEIQDKPHIDVSHQGITVWMWSKKQDEYPLFNHWLAVMGGQVAGIYNKDGEPEDRFCVGISVFVFDNQSKKRIGLVTGESTIEFVFKHQHGEPAKWLNLGWHNDAFGEWEYVSWDEI